MLTRMSGSKTRSISFRQHHDVPRDWRCWPPCRPAGLPQRSYPAGLCSIGSQCIKLIVCPGPKEVAAAFRQQVEGVRFSLALEHVPANGFKIEENLAMFGAGKIARRPPP